MTKHSNLSLLIGIFCYTLFGFLMGYYINDDKENQSLHGIKAAGILWAILIAVSLLLSFILSADPFMMMYLWSGIFNGFIEFIIWLASQL